MCLTEIENFIIHVTPAEGKFVIRLIVRNTCEGYYGELLKIDLVNGAVSLEIPYEKYESESLKAITSTGGLPDFKYSFEENIFSWTKKFDDCPFRIFFGKIKMIESPTVVHTLMCYNLVNNFLTH